jgi:hypothetical protein
MRRFSSEIEDFIGVAMDSPKFQPGVSGMARGWPAAVFYPFGHPMSYAYGSFANLISGVSHEDRQFVDATRRFTA